MQRLDAWTRLIGYDRTSILKMSIALFPNFQNLFSPQLSKAFVNREIFFQDRAIMFGFSSQRDIGLDYYDKVIVLNRLILSVTVG